MSVEFYRGSPRSFDSRALNRKTLNRWTSVITTSQLALHAWHLSQARAWRIRQRHMIVIDVNIAYCTECMSTQV